MKKCVQCKRDLPLAATHCVFCKCEQPAATKESMRHTMMGFARSESGPMQAIAPLSTLESSQQFAEKSVSMDSANHRATTMVGTPAPAKDATSFGDSQPIPKAPNHIVPAQTSSSIAVPESAVTRVPNAHDLRNTRPPEQPTNSNDDSKKQPNIRIRRPTPALIASPIKVERTTLPPYLASRTVDRMNSPVEPWATMIKPLLIATGIALLLCFLLPWSFTDNGVRFIFSQLGAMSPADRLVPLLIAGTGILSVFLGILPLTSIAQSTICCFLCLGTICYSHIGPTSFALPLSPTAGATMAYPITIGLPGALLIAIGLLLRSEYKSSLLARVSVTGGAIITLLPFVVPFGGIPAIETLLTTIGNGQPTQRFAALIALSPILFAMISMMVWLQGPSSSGARGLAWLWIGLPMLLIISTLITSVDSILPSFGTTVILPICASLWRALFVFGAAILIGKFLESSEV